MDRKLRNADQLLKILPMVIAENSVEYYLTLYPRPNTYARTAPDWVVMYGTGLMEKSNILYITYGHSPYQTLAAMYKKLQTSGRIGAHQRPAGAVEGEKP